MTTPQTEASFRFSFLKTCTQEFPHRKVYQPDPRTGIDLVVIEKSWMFYDSLTSFGGFLCDKVTVNGHRRIVVLITEELLASLSDEELAVRYYSSALAYH